MVMQVFSKFVVAGLVLVMLGVMASTTQQRVAAQAESFSPLEPEASQDQARYNLYKRTVNDTNHTQGPWQFVGTYNSIGAAIQAGDEIADRTPNAYSHWRVSITHHNQVVWSRQ
jgi:hypothetical protein